MLVCALYGYDMQILWLTVAFSTLNVLFYLIRWVKVKWCGMEVHVRTICEARIDVQADCGGP